MTRDDILRMARKAGWPSMAVDNLPGTQEMSRLERFSAQVAAHERKACVLIITREAQAYSEPVWAVEIVNDICARGEK